MAVIETWFQQDFSEPVKVKHLDGFVFSSDDKANLIGVRMYRNGSPQQLYGSIIGYCVLADGMSIPVNGNISENSASIIVPDSAYSVPGPISFVIKNVDGASVTTLACIVSIVHGVSGVTVDPSQEIISMWTAQINAAIADVEDSAVLYSEAQSLTAEQKQQARNNISASAYAVLRANDDYRIVIP